MVVGGAFAFEAKALGSEPGEGMKPIQQARQRGERLDEPVEAPDVRKLV